ncbi:hypothetical protein TcWFU_006997 [Taenia crassiceps]|uniref:Uncharacterized protein n=1 Tax=Taenia crassiceps TaxID=6207 RepID=A0ABR4Q2Y9_9CEST
MLADVTAMTTHQWFSSRCYRGRRFAHAADLSRGALMHKAKNAHIGVVAEEPVIGAMIASNLMRGRAISLYRTMQMDFAYPCNIPLSDWKSIKDVHFWLGIARPRHCSEQVTATTGSAVNSCSAPAAHGMNASCPLFSQPGYSGHGPVAAVPRTYPS